MIILISIYSSVCTQQNQIKKKAKKKKQNKKNQTKKKPHRKSNNNSCGNSKHNPIQYQKFRVHLGTAHIT